MPIVNRRHFLTGAAAAVGAVGAQTRKAGEQTFVAGIVPGRAPAGAGAVPPSRPSPAPNPATFDQAAVLASFWKACDECSSLGIHNIEVNNTHTHIVQAYDGRFAEFQEEMGKRNLRMLGFAMYSHLHETANLPEMIEEHLRVAKFLAKAGGRYIAELIAPSAVLGNGDDESYRTVDMKAVVANANEIGKRVTEQTPIRIGYHPEQGDIRAGIWRRMVDETDPRYYNFWPDVGHLVACGQDPLALYKQYRTRMVGTHLRDFAPAAAPAPGAEPARGRMVPFGEGIIKLPALVQYLRDTGFAGSVMGEGGGTAGMRNYMVDKLGLRL